MEENIYEKTIQDLESLKNSYIIAMTENRKLKEKVSNLEQRNKHLEKIVYKDNEVKKYVLCNDKR